MRYGASIGARAVCVAPVTVGRWALVAAGSVVVQTFPTSRSSPASPRGSCGGWDRPASRSGPTGHDRFRCPQTGACTWRLTETLREEP